MVPVEDILKSKYFLAPMAGITDLPFRLFMREMGAEVVISELISSEGFAHGSHKTREMIKVHPDEHPVGLQIFGSNDDKMTDIALACEEAGADFVDINFGCPVPKVVKCGAGSAMLRDPKRMAQQLRKIKSKLSIPLSIKIRTGWNDHEITAKEVIKVAADEGIAWISVHGRTREQGYSGFADWSIIEELHQMNLIPVIGNGDVNSKHIAQERIEQGYCHAVMLGRVALSDPLIFQACLDQEDEEVEVRFNNALKRFFELVMEYNHPKVAHTKLKKMFVWYASGMTGKGPFRKQIFSFGNEPENIFAFAKEFFTAERIHTRKRNDLTFLKGGHG